MTDPDRTAVVLLSGGLDSATTLAVARSREFACFTLSFAYGQRHAVESEKALAVSKALGAVRHLEMAIDLRSFGGSALTEDLPVPKGRDEENMSREIPITYVPARNTVFLSFALAWAETLPADHVFIGVNAVDYSGYPDCRPEYLEAFQSMARLATRRGVTGQGAVTIHAPLLQLKKSEIVRLGTDLGVDYSLTHSCYDPDEAGRSCGQCDSCRLRLRGFEEAGLLDPVPYAP